MLDHPGARRARAAVLAGLRRAPRRLGLSGPAGGSLACALLGGSLQARLAGRLDADRCLAQLGQPSHHRLLLRGDRPRLGSRGVGLGLRRLTGGIGSLGRVGLLGLGAARGGAGRGGDVGALGGLLEGGGAGVADRGHPHGAVGEVLRPGAAEVGLEAAEGPVGLVHQGGIAAHGERGGVRLLLGGGRGGRGVLRRGGRVVEADPGLVVGLGGDLDLVLHRCEVGGGRVVRRLEGGHGGARLRGCPPGRVDLRLARVDRARGRLRRGCAAGHRREGDGRGDGHPPPARAPGARGG